MKFFDKFFKGKGKEDKNPKTEQVIEKKIIKTELRTICADDLEVYEALRTTMLLDPKKIENSMEEIVEKGKYAIAGGLAIYKGDVEKVKEYFSKYAEQTGKKLKILEIPERAVEKAQEYYAKYLKTS